jgi:hypothetical protein
VTHGAPCPDGAVEDALGVGLGDGLADGLDDGDELGDGLEDADGLDDGDGLAVRQHSTATKGVRFLDLLRAANLPS